LTLQLTLTHLITLAVFFLGTLFGLVKYIVYQQEQREKDRYATLANSLASLGTELRQEAEATLQLERQLMQFKAELPRDYVRRDDFVRAIGTIEAKVDNFALRMERALMTRNSGGAAT
jgi:hypothetical protein